jgi:predicted outer membrane lipoprotein
MKTTVKSTLAALSFAIITAIAFSGCESRGRGSGSGMHSMGNPKHSFPMSDQGMPGR